MSHDKLFLNLFNGKLINEKNWVLYKFLCSSTFSVHHFELQGVQYKPPPNVFLIRHLSLYLRGGYDLNIQIFLQDYKSHGRRLLSEVSMQSHSSSPAK